MDSVRLEESTDYYVARPRDLALDARDGSYFLADGFWKQVYWFNREGRLQRVFGQRGTGTGRIMILGPVFVHGSTVIAADLRRRVVHLYDRETAQLTRTRPTDGILQRFARDGDTLWLGILNAVRKTGIAVWDVKRDSITYLVRTPSQYSQSHLFANIFNVVNVLPDRDRVLVGFSGLNSLFVVTRSGVVVDTVVVPAVNRQGFDPSLLTRMDKMPWERALSSTSALMHLRQLPTGEFLLLHYDQDAAQQEITRTKVYVSILSADLRRACVDTKLPVAERTSPAAALQGDTLLVIQQRTARAGRAATWIHRFWVTSRDCDWLPTKPVAVAKAQG